MCLHHVLATEMQSSVYRHALRLSSKAFHFFISFHTHFKEFYFDVILLRSSGQKLWIFNFYILVCSVHETSVFVFGLLFLSYGRNLPCSFPKPEHTLSNVWFMSGFCFIWEWKSFTFSENYFLKCYIKIFLDDWAWNSLASERMVESTVDFYFLFSKLQYAYPFSLQIFLSLITLTR